MTLLLRVYMEAVKLESMHAPEHAMSSLVVAQVLSYKAHKVKVIRVLPLVPWVILVI